MTARARRFCAPVAALSFLLALVAATSGVSASRKDVNLVAATSGLSASRKDANLVAATTGLSASREDANLVAASPGPSASRKDARNAASAPVDPAALSTRLLEDARRSRGAYLRLQWLTDRIGARLSGTPAATQAITWAADAMKKDGLDNVRLEPVIVPRWERGDASVELVRPVSIRLVPLALGGSVPTPPEGLSAPVVIARSLEELTALGDKVRGSIVLFDKQIKAGKSEEEGYGAGSKLRHDGPSAAARLGAVGMLIRSLGTASFRLPHTGATSYEEDAPRIPAAAITAEDADLIARFAAAGETPVVRMKLGCRSLPDAESSNVIGELRGKERPEEVVVISAHLDSWDVGQGAIDDGAGVVMVLESMRMLRQLERRPRRTIRAILYINEENGLRGGRTYAAQHKDEMARHVAAIESDGGAGRPLGMSVDAGEGGRDQLQSLFDRFAGLGRLEATTGDGGGADISRMARYGVPLIGLSPDTTRYFDWHHTEADTLDKVDPEELAGNTALLAWTAFMLADADRPLPRQTPTEKELKPEPAFPLPTAPARKVK